MSTNVILPKWGLTMEDGTVVAWHVEVGDTVVLYTDGLPEGMSTDHEEWGDQKYLRTLVKYAHRDPADYRDQILEEFRKFTSGEPLHDDVTLAIVVYEGH